MLSIVLFVSIVSVATLNLTKLDAYAISFDARCQRYLLFQGKEDYMYFYRKNNQFKLWIMQNANNYEVYALPQQDVLVFKWSDLTINGLKMDMVFHRGEIRYPLSFITETLLCKINELSGTSFVESPPAAYKHRVESGKDTLIAAGLLCFLTVVVGIFVALATNFKKESQTEGSNTSFASKETVYINT